ncbi:putative photosynthetic complex assembly protein PuhE [Rhodophyticola sp. SM2404]
MLHSPWIAALVALFLWWFSTGAILVAVRRADKEGPHARVWSVLMNTPFLIIGAIGIIETLEDGSVTGAYIGFLSALALWGWVELAFLAGVITGPNRNILRDGVPEWERFIRAWGTIAYHELLLVFMVVALVLMSFGAENQVGVLTFTLLFVARISAKLNLYLGVRKINLEFIPDHLHHLPSHFRIARMNWLFPISITGLSLALGLALASCLSAQDQGEIVGYALIAALTALALLEHWFMVLPLPDERLWRWMLPQRETGAISPPNLARLHSEDAR